MDLLGPGELYSILRRIDEEFFDNEAFEMFRKNGCCVNICLEGICYFDPRVAGFCRLTDYQTGGYKNYYL